MSKETQNKWEKKILKIINPLYDPDVDTAEIRCVEEALINSIDSIVSEAFERGKEEGRKEKQRIYTVTNGGCIVLADTDMQKYEDSIKEEIRLQTLEEVEREIKEEKTLFVDFTVYRGQELISKTNILQTINKMKK